MELLGAAAPCAGPLLDQVREAAWAGRPCLFWSDGDDTVAVIAGQGESAADLLKLAARVLPEVGG